MVDAAGNAVTVSYDPVNSILLQLADALGHSLTVQGSGACPAYASQLIYDGTLVARYSMSSGMLTGVTDTAGTPLRSYTYVNVGQSQPKLQAVLSQSGTAIAEFSYDSRGMVSGLIDSESSVNVSYNSYCNGLQPGLTWVLRCISEAVATEYYHGPYGDTNSETKRQLITSTILGAGPNRSEMGAIFKGGVRTPQLLAWTNEGKPARSVDFEGHNVRRDFDSLGRVNHRIEYLGSTYVDGFGWGFQSVPKPLPNDSREEWRDYGITRPVAQGLNLDLDLVTTIRRSSNLQPGAFSEEVYDYSQAPASMDPSGYACTTSPLPEGSVLCRHISSGYVTSGSGAALERHATFFSYDARGRLTRTYGPVNLDLPGPNDVPPIEERTYRGDGESPARQGRLAQVKRYSSPNGQPLVTSYDYDLFGVSLVTAPDGTSASISKDAQGRPTFVTYSDASGSVQARTETRYYDGSTPRLRILPSGAAERYSYDTKGRLARLEQFSGDPEASGASPSVGWSESYVYDQSGNRIHAERRDAQGTITWQQDRAYDADHHVAWESNPSLPSAGRSWSFTPSGFLSGTVDEEGRAVTFTPDGVGRVANVQRSGLDAQGNAATMSVATYQRNPYQDDLASVTDGASHVTSYRHDDFGRVELVSSATLSRGGGTWYRYDARGNVIARSDATVNVSFTYDGLDRLISLQSSNSTDGSSLRYAYGYDAPPFAGRLTSITEPDRTTYFTYDWAGRLKSEIMYENGVSVPFTTGYDYDVNGRLRQLTYPSGLAVQFVRDPATGEVVTVKNAADGTKYADQVTHYPAGPWAALTFGNGLSLSQTFSLRYEPLSINSGPLQLAYGPSPAGNIGVTIDRSQDPSGCVRGVTRVFTYDLLDRLSGWSDAAVGGTGTCPPDSIGANAGAFTYVSGTDQIASQQTASPNGVPVFAFGYDAQGNISAVGQYDSGGANLVQQLCLRHDSLGRLVLVGYEGSALTPGGTACVTDAEVPAALARFKYDARNRRVARQQNGQWTYVVSDASGNPLSEFALTTDQTTPWVKIRDYVWLDGRLLAQIEYSGNTGPVYTYYAHLDHLGTPRALTNQSGQLVWATYQRPYGEVLEKTTPDPLSGQVVKTNIRLPGQYDERLFQMAGIDMQGPYYNWNRWYLPSVGRYLELDPISMRGVVDATSSFAPPAPDWYIYARGSPLAFIDIEGLTAYICTKPLDFLGGQDTPLSQTKSWFEAQWNPLFHQYLCTDVSGKMECGGLTKKGGFLGWGPGTQSHDFFAASRCEKTPSNRCLERCVSDAINSPIRPFYSLLGLPSFMAENCQQWAAHALQQCQDQCAASGAFQ